MAKKYLVTGGAGFIGSNIVKELLAKGVFVRVVDNLATGRKENIEEFLSNPNFEFIEGDLTSLEVAQKVAEGIDFVLHEAAVPSVPRSIEDPLRSHDANITATLNMLIASRDQKVKNFVYASSSSIYGDNPQLPKKEDFPVMPISPYALTKYAGERYAQIFYKIYGLNTICLRYFNVFGPKQNPNSQYAAVIPKFIIDILDKKKPVIYGTGEQSRDFTFVENVVQANILAAESDNGFGEVFNVACNQETSLNQLVTMLEEIIGNKTGAEYEEARQGDVPHSRADIAKAQEILGYNPKVTIREGLEKTVEYLKNAKR
ncbi:MAG: SDR family oxidoreductase [Candidatus Staskawiczbacteria bacterium]|nr:SDR family oxidoreductase [Candidatus Staskawiczbacteria bacterium]